MIIKADEEGKRQIMQLCELAIKGIVSIPPRIQPLEEPPGMGKAEFIDKTLNAQTAKGAVASKTSKSD